MPGKSPFKPSSSVEDPPFALDEYPKISSERELQLTKLNFWNEQGFPLQGGQKEARLRRVAILQTSKNVDQMFTVKVENINPKITTAERLYDEFIKFGAIGDVYIPRNVNVNIPYSHSFAYIRFMEKEAAEAALKELENQEEALVIDRQKITVKSPEKPMPGFGRVPSFRCITVGAIEEPLKEQKFEQAISLEQCMARNGAPWTSKSDLKRLEPHAPPHINDLFGVRVTNLHKSVDEYELRKIFETFGAVAYSYCPKPLQVILWNPSNPNEGKAVVRFMDRRAAELAVKELDGKDIHGQTVRLDLVFPQCWPNEKSRRYF